MSRDVYASNEKLWGLLPVRWGLQMMPRDGQGTIQPFHNRFDARHEVWKFLGVSIPAGDDDKFLDRGRDAAVALEIAIAEKPDVDSILFRNLRLLQAELGFDDLQSDILAIRVMSAVNPGFEQLVDGYFGRCSTFVLRRKLASLLGVPDARISNALARSGLLAQRGLLDVSRCNHEQFDEHLTLMRGLDTALTTEMKSERELLAALLPTAREATLELSAYPHLGQEVHLLRACLGAGADVRAKGVNVLLYGAPGTGKTELAAALAKSLGLPLYAVPSAWENSWALNPRERLREVGQLQRLVDVTGRSLVLVDEAEDLFPTAWSDADKIPTKVAVNECLETSPTPTIWISNRTRHMDEAFLRRFDMVVYVPALPTLAKRELLCNLVPPGTLQGMELRRFTARRELSPAMITRLARVASLGTSGDPGRVRDNLVTLSNQYLRTMGARPLPVARGQASLQYDPTLLNCDPPLGSAIDALAGHGVGARLLLHGSPGTGKTALGKLLSERFDRPLLQRQASSLLSCYLGETEQNLRDMFDEARRENGILLLDEADSFLRNRDQARARWEVTQTNELLTQMEDFEGIFICTTNRLDDLDPAALRRFDFKVAFKPLRFDQRVRLIRCCCAALGIDASDDGSWAARARQLDGLTPGDAAAALRRLRLSPGTSSIATLLGALADECGYKPTAHAPIGFVR